MIILTKANRNNRIIGYSSTYVDFIKIIQLVNKINYILDNYDHRYRNYDYDYFEFKKFKYYFTKYSYVNSKLDIISYFNYSGNLHREDGPAWIYYYSNGKINNKGYFLNGKQYSYMDYILDIKRRV